VTLSERYRERGTERDIDTDLKQKNVLFRRLLGAVADDAQVESELLEIFKVEREESQQSRDMDTHLDIRNLQRRVECRETHDSASPGRGF
jgi:hypothetical protein